MTNKDKVEGLFQYMCESLGLDISVQSRKMDYVIARGVFTDYARRIGYSFGGIGQILGGRTHATMINSHAKTEGFRNEPFYQACVDAAEGYLEAMGIIGKREKDSILTSLIAERHELRKRLQVIETTIKFYEE